MNQKSNKETIPYNIQPCWVLWENKGGRGDTGSCRVRVGSLIFAERSERDPSKVVTLSGNMLTSWGREFQAEGTCAKALRQEHIRHVGGIMRGWCG